MEIRKAIISDIENIILLNKLDDYENPDLYIHEAILKWLVQLAVLNKIIVWFTLIELVWWNTPLLALIKIHPNFQRKWIGKRLILSSENILKEKWFNVYCSSTIRENNSARKFHDALRFKEVWILNLPHWQEIFYIKDI